MIEKMKLNKKYLLPIGFLFFFLAGIALASSTQFLSQAQQYINDNCGKKNISDQTALLCYLFNKVQEHDASIAQINTTLSPIPEQINTLSNQVASLSASITPIPTPPFKGILVAVGSFEDPGGLGYYFNMSPRIVSNNYQTFYNSYQQLISDCWATAHFSNGDALALNTRRDDPLKAVSPNHVLPPTNAQIPIDLNCSWGGSTIQF